MPFYPTGGTTYYLGASIGSTDTTILLSSFLEPISGTPYTMALMNTTIAYGTIAPISAQSEFISFTGITQNADGTATLTGVTRGLSRSYPYTSSSTYKLPHAGQSIFILSDSPALFNKYAVIENDNAFTGANTVPTPSAPTEIANKAYVDLVAGGIATTNQIIVTGTAGETITKDQLVYLKATDGKWWLADADAAATSENIQLGIAQGAGSTDANISGGILTYGLATLTAFTVTAGTKYYVSNTAGGISTSAGTKEVTVGESPAGSTTTLFFFPRFDQQVTEDELDAMSGGGTLGTPNATNKFVTQQGLSGIKFGGTGADGALTITSGTTTIDCANAAVVVKNYSSISITGTGKLAFSNPNTNGTTIILLCTGDVTITSSTVPAIDASGMGAAGGAGGLGVSFTDGQNGYGFLRAKTLAATNNTGASTASSDFVNSIDSVYTFLAPYSCPGAGGASGGAAVGGGGSTATSGNGGRGGGVLIISCLGAYNVTSTLSVAGLPGTNGSGTGIEYTAGGGGGGAGGEIIVYYGSLTADSGTYTVSAGAAGTGASTNNVGAPNYGGGGAGSIKNAGATGSGGCGGSDTGCNGGVGGAGWFKINT